MALTREFFLEREQQHLLPERRRDAAAITAFLHPGYREITQSGALKDYGYYCGASFDTDARVVFEYNIEILAQDLVLATYRLLNSTRSTESYRSSLWKQTHGDWQLLFHQGTPIPKA